METPDVVVANGLRKRFGQLLAVDMNLSVAAGEIFGLLGPNGAGKTTTLKLLMGLLVPDVGSLSVLGMNVARDAVAIRRRVGYVPEETSLYDELTVHDNLRFFADLYRLDKSTRKARIATLLDLFDLAGRAGDRAGKLSKGLKRRVVIAQALVHEPELLILDEPTSGLDVKSTRLLRKIVKDVNDELGTTILLTTHQIDEAAALCSRVAIMKAGTILACDRPGALQASVTRRTVLDIVLEPAEGQSRDDQNISPQGIEDGLHAIPGVHGITRDGSRYKIVVGDITTMITGIARILETSSLRVASLSSREPSLEDAFVEITGLDVESMKEGEQA